MRIRIISSLVVAAAALALVVSVSGCGGSSSAEGSSGSKSVSLVAYSTPQVVYDQIIPAFKKTEAGAGVSFKESYGASGDQSRAVEAGLKADIVAFSLAPDVDRLVKDGLVSPDWASATPHNGFVSTSLVSFIVRKGNPKGIHGWDDLLRPGVKVVT